MKISNELRNAYAEAHDKFIRLSSDVKDVLQGVTESKNWFFNARVKELQSYALKVETGRVRSPADLEDFYACTIIVPTISKIPEAESEVVKHFDLVTRRPKNDGLTHKFPSDFVFDDLRLYVRKRASDTGRNQDLEGLVFEVQIKSILQYAWGIASHDLIYKTDTVSWSKERIAFQVKAMLEHAELAISEAEKLAQSESLSKSNNHTNDISKIITCILRFWQKENLPSDVKRLAENFKTVLNICDLSPDRLHGILEKEKNRLGSLPLNLSPYSFFVQALAHNPTVNLERCLAESRKSQIFVHSDMELPAWMQQENPKIYRVK